MQIRRVKALTDTEGRDISGNRVNMFKNTAHLVSEVDVEFYLARPLLFEVSPDVDIAVYAYDALGKIIGLILPDGTYHLFLGERGDNGWSPLFAVVSDGLRRVLQVTDWVGGQGAKPTIAVYVGATGLTTLLVNAVDIRGVAGADGVNGTQGIQGLQGLIGVTGASGRGIATFVRTFGTGAPGTTDVYTMTFTDATTTTISVANGANGLNGTGGGGAATVPTLIVLNQTFTIPLNSQVLFSEEIDFEAGAFISVDSNSILTQVN